MNILLVLAFLFFVGSIIGWILEFFFRNLIAHDGPKGLFFINPGFCYGPYLPIYGFGLVAMFLVTYISNEIIQTRIVIIPIIIIGLTMTLIEMIGGLILLKFNVRLWDYSHLWGNFKGVICPIFGLLWTLLGAIFYLLIYPICINGIIWLSNNLAFSFFIGLFYGVFIIDIFFSSKLIYKIKKIAEEYNGIIFIDRLKGELQKLRLSAQEKLKFFNQLKIDRNSLIIILKNNYKVIEKKVLKRKGHHN